MTYSNISVSTAKFWGTHAWHRITGVAQHLDQCLTLTRWVIILWSAKSYSISLAFLLNMAFTFWLQLKSLKTWFPLQLFKVMTVYSTKLYVPFSVRLEHISSLLLIAHSPFFLLTKKDPSIFKISSHQTLHFLVAVILLHFLKILPSFLHSHGLVLQPISATYPLLPTATIS